MRILSTDELGDCAEGVAGTVLRDFPRDAQVTMSSVHVTWSGSRQRDWWDRQSSGTDPGVWEFRIKGVFKGKKKDHLLRSTLEQLAGCGSESSASRLPQNLVPGGKNKKVK